MFVTSSPAKKRKKQAPVGKVTAASNANWINKGGGFLYNKELVVGAGAREPAEGLGRDGHRRQKEEHEKGREVG